MPGHEAVRIYQGEDGWYVDGSCVFLFEGQPCRLEYLIECDPEWRTSFVTVDGFVGDDVVAIELEIDGVTVKIAQGADADTISAVIAALRATR